CGLLLLLGIINFPCRFYHFYWIRYVVDRATCNLRSQIYEKLQKLPMSFYSTSKQGGLISTILNDSQVFSQGFRYSVDIIREPLTALVMLGMALYRDWLLTMVIVVVSPFFVIIFQSFGRKVRENQNDVQAHISEVTHTVNEGVGGQKVTKAFNIQKYVLGRFEKAQWKFFLAQVRTTVAEELAHPLVEFVGAIAFIGVILLAHYRINSGAMSTGDFVSFVTALALLMDPIRKFSQANVRLNQAQAAGMRIFDIFKLPEEKNLGDAVITHFQNEIVVENLTFSYGDGEILKNLSLRVKRGQKIAMVGLSGSGKSTLLNILLGFYPVTQGRITIDGVDLKDIKLSSLRSCLGLVSQDVFLFHDTIRENLTLGKAVSAEQIEKALEVSNATNFIKEFPKGLETIIGDRGTRLSGGQCQRLTIARAYLHDPQILLFDEATSSLDNESEKVVQAALSKLAGDKTLIAVAHRLSTIQDFDQIYVLHRGCLEEQGTHQELMNLGGEYAKLYELGMKS
ncbi:MAG: ABC transporter ATP-binding protein, partial [Pseudomonadota bacterium]